MDAISITIGEIIHKIIRVLKPNQFDSEFDKIKIYPLDRARYYFKENHSYALLNVPYYRNYDIEDTNYPRLTKDIIRSHFDELKSERIKEIIGCRENTSGGSTGTPVRFVQDEEYFKFVGYALKYWHEEILGQDMWNLRKLFIWGSEKDLFSWTGDWTKKLWGVISNTRYVNAFSLTENDMVECVKLINLFRPEMIRGYANSLVELSKYVKRNKLIVNKPLFVISSAETLTDEMRAIINEVFDCPIFNFYGSRECGAIAGQCKEGLMHMFTFNHFIEIVNDQGNEVEPGQEGNILVTTLHNKSMPLLRFEIGDIAVKGPLKCKCGNPLPTLLKISGRISENFIKKDGTIIHGEFFTHLFYFKAWLKQFQVIQEDYDKLQIYLSLNPDYTFQDEEGQEIKYMIQKVMGFDCQINFVFVDEIPKSPQGKFLFTHSKVLR